MQKRKVVIIGSGVAGMTCAIYLKRYDVDVLVIEKDAPGGQMLKSSVIENYPGFINIDGPSLSYKIYEQVNNLKVDYLFDEVVSVKNENGKKIVQTKHDKIESEYVVLATGRTSRTLNLDREKEFIGKGISFCALCDGNLYKGKDVVIIGGGNSALEEAIYLSNICNKVVIVHRKDKFTAEDSMIETISTLKNVEIKFKANVEKYNIIDDKIKSVILDTGEEIKCDGVFIAIGYVPINDLIDVDKENGYIIVDNNNETSIKNIYACGDAIKKNAYQISTAIGEATNVSYSIIKQIKQ